VYTDYYVKIWMDREQVSEMCLEEDVDLSASLVALDGDTPVGIALLSVREQQGWISSVGVLRAWRRRGIAYRIMRQLLQTARLKKLWSVRLEVLQQNTPAIGLYKDLGFVWERDLLVLTLEPAAVSALSSSIQRVQPIAPQTALEAYSALHDTRAPWQRDLATLRRRTAALAGMGYYDGRLAGYVLYQIQSTNCAILDLAVDPDHPRRHEIADALLKAVHHRHRLLEGYIINVPSNDPLLRAFFDLGYSRWQQQYEFIWRP
jgi:ribosomal protein S18 acetylase RimI-like enzyme